MSAFNHLANQTLTPRHKTQSPARPGHGADNKLRFSIRKIIGVSAPSSSTADCLPGCGRFATCAGPAVVLYHVDEQLAVTQRIFHAAPDAEAVYKPPSFYSSCTPPRPRDRAARQSLAGDGSVSFGSPSSSGLAHASRGWAKPTSRNRSASCVSLSSDGLWLAVGEVCLVSILAGRKLNNSDRI